uniref:WDHD1/CFT4 second beta-propeller domain-containing protein n=1 Tax=Glossina palpalis gambiensis TaxID=67801 RepID=A0A1B0AN42_9MUSC
MFILYKCILFNNDFDEIEFTGDTNDAAERLAKIKTTNDDDDDYWQSIEKLKNQIKTYNGEDLSANKDTKDSVFRNESLSLCIGKNAPAVSNGFKLQTAFQPNHTSIHLKDRYLVWNGVGIVTSHADGANGAIDVVFHDANVHHSLHIHNYNNHNMANLSSTALVLAGKDSAKLIVIALAASGNKEWSTQLSEEDVVTVVATTKLIAVGKSMQFLRFFTITDSQREIIHLSGSAIYLSGFEDRIMLSYHAAPASQKQRNITAILLYPKFKVQKYNFSFNAGTAIGTAGI